MLNQNHPKLLILFRVVLVTTSDKITFVVIACKMTCSDHLRASGSVASTNVNNALSMWNASKCEIHNSHGNDPCTKFIKCVGL